MKTKKLLKALGVVLAAVALVVVSVLGTMAWLTDTTDEVVNTITVGNVDLDLYETVTTEVEGSPVTTEVKAQNYKLFPGQTYSKNPTVEVQSGSEECYIRVKITVTNATAWAGQFNSCIDLQSGWTCVNPDATADGEDKIVYEYRYADVIDASATDVAKAVFTTLTVPGTWTNETITSDETITVVAHGIQATGMTNAADAWAKFDA